MTGKYHRLRRVSGAVLLMVLVGLPFLRVNGESAFRFDVPTLRLLFFGAQIGMADFFIILVALIFVTLFTLFVTTLFGRLWCGWLCPQTVLLDATDLIEKVRHRGPAVRVALSAAGIAASGVIAAALIGYFVAPAEIPGLLRSGGTAAKIIAWSWISMTVLLYLDLTLLRRNFCATVCPYAKLQGVLFDDSTLLVAFDATRSKECMECKACVRACPVGIDIRKGPQSACIHCAECVDACSERMAAGKRKSLIDYSFGVPGIQRTGSRVFPYLSGGLTFLALLLLVFLIGSKSPFDLGVLLLYSAEPVLQADGSASNVYELALRNKTGTDLKLELRVAAAFGKSRISPSSLTIPADGSVTRIRAVITLVDAAGSRRDQKVTISARSPEYGKLIAQEVYFIMPKQR